MARTQYSTQAVQSTEEYQYLCGYFKHLIWRERVFASLQSSVGRKLKWAKFKFNPRALGLTFNLCICTYYVVNLQRYTNTYEYLRTRQRRKKCAMLISYKQLQ